MHSFDSIETIWCAMKQKRRVVAYFGEWKSRNLGDVAVYLAFNRLASPSVNVIPLRLSSNLLERMIDKITLSMCESIVVGGGTQFTPTNKSILSFLLNQGKPVWSFGTGVGSCGFSERAFQDIRIIKEEINLLSMISVRGPRSAKSLSDLGISSNVIGDPALSLSSTRHDIVLALMKKILVSLLPAVEGEEMALYATFKNNLASALAHYIKKGFKLKFVAMGPGDYREADDFIRNYKFNDVEIIKIYEDINQFFELAKSCDFVISMRLHGAILSATVGIPFLLVNYREKCEDFVESIDALDSLVSADIDSSQIISLFDYLLAERIKKNHHLLTMASHYQQCQRNFIASVV